MPGPVTARLLGHHLLHGRDLRRADRCGDGLEPLGRVRRLLGRTGGDGCDVAPGGTADRRPRRAPRHGRGLLPVGPRLRHPRLRARPRRLLRGLAVPGPGHAHVPVRGGVRGSGADRGPGGEAADLADHPARRPRLHRLLADRPHARRGVRLARGAALLRRHRPSDDSPAPRHPRRPLRAPASGEDGRRQAGSRARAFPGGAPPSSASRW